MGVGGACVAEEVEPRAESQNAKAETPKRRVPTAFHAAFMPHFRAYARGWKNTLYFLLLRLRLFRDVGSIRENKEFLTTSLF